ncbi:Alpha/Beta hydrolase protein [Auriculariales sp. MPI-PUGE-AT-0066]|nr:Alpha/Beta hydrolase protein [Auriculariales sp. MPI-PUGE-AT-0066]
MSNWRAPNRITSRVVIPHPDEPGVELVGTLEQLVDLPTPAGPRPIALILHGVMGHKDYLWQKTLAHSLPLDSFRFDFRGNHESGGRWNYAGFLDEVRDLEAVVRYLNAGSRYRVALIVAHSRGSIGAFHWLCTSPLAGQVSAYVNITARFRMDKVYNKAGFAPEDRVPGQDYFEWKEVVARKPRVERVYQSDIDTFAKWQSDIVEHAFPKHIHVLTLHGLADDLVFPTDAVLYYRALSNRGSDRGTSTIYLVHGANHNFQNDRNVIVRAVLGWLDIPRSQRQTGVFLDVPSQQTSLLTGLAGEVVLDDVVESFSRIEREKMAQAEHGADRHAHFSQSPRQAVTRHPVPLLSFFLATTPYRHHNQHCTLLNIFHLPLSRYLGLS